MTTARWNGVILAQSDACERVEGNAYFPPSAVKSEFLEASRTHSVCPWKGEASYYHLNVGGKQNRDAAWYYPETLPKAEHIRGFVAFWKGVEIED